MAQIHVERAAMDDVEAIWAIVERAVGHADMRMKIMENVDKRNVYVAKSGFTVVGFAMRENNFFDFPYISGLYVTPEYEDHAVGAMLVDYMIKTNPADRLFTSAPASDEITKYMFEKLGFRRSGMVYHVNDKNESEIIFVKLLT